MNNNWLDIEILEDYLDGKLDAKTMNRVEREALEDPFVAEALAGLSASPKRSLESLSLLQKQLAERVAEQHIQKRTTVITWQRLSIAATAAVLFVAVSIIFWMKENNHQKQLAGQPKNIEVEIAPKPATEEAAPVPEVKSSEKETDKAIAAATTNAYAANVKRKADKVAPSASQELNEVVVVGYDVAQKKSAVAVNDSAQRNTTATFSKARVAAVKQEQPEVPMPAYPVGGWENMEDYLKKNNRFGNEARIGKSVHFTFIIDKDGRPSQVKITAGLDRKYNKEAIRLILNGPKWETAEAPGKSISFKIDF